MPDTPTAEIDPADVRSFIETVSADDRVLFNDRSRPLTVDRVHSGGTSFTSWEYAEIEGPRGGVYQIRWEQHRESEPSVHVRRHTGYNDDGFRMWDERQLTDVEIVDHFELTIGQVFVSHGEKLTHYEVVTGFSDKQTGDAQTVDVRVRDGEVRGVRESCVFNSIIKERLFDDYIEHVETLPIGYRKTTGQFHDAETGQAVYLSDGHKRGVDVRPFDGSGLDVVGWETILLGFEDRFSPLNDEEGDDEHELVTDGGEDQAMLSKYGAGDRSNVALSLPEDGIDLDAKREVEDYAESVATGGWQFCTVTNERVTWWDPDGPPVYWIERKSAGWHGHRGGRQVPPKYTDDLQAALDGAGEYMAANPINGGEGE